LTRAAPIGQKVRPSMPSASSRARSTSPGAPWPCSSRSSSSYRRVAPTRQVTGQALADLHQVLAARGQFEHGVKTGGRVHLSRREFQSAGNTLDGLRAEPAVLLLGQVQRGQQAGADARGGDGRGIDSHDIILARMGGESKRCVLTPIPRLPPFSSSENGGRGCSICVKICVFSSSSSPPPNSRFWNLGEAGRGSAFTPPRP
jgi:hypothetical protein